MPTLLDVQLFFCRFLAHQRPSIVPPYALHTNADVRGDPLHPPQSTPRHTSNTRICLHTSAEIHRYDIRTDTNLHHGHRRQCVSCIRSRGRLDLPYDDGGASRGRHRQTDTCVAGVAWCGMWRAEVPPYVGIRIGGIGWNFGGSLIG